MASFFTREWRHFLLALGFFTRIPVPSFADFKESDLNHAAKYFPLVGVLVGLFCAVAFSAANKVFTQDIAVIFSMIAGLLLTGAFHEDGLSDSVDGLGGGWEREQVLTIMQDSRIGSFGAIAIVIALLLKFTTLTHLSPILLPLLLVIGHSLSRLCAVLVMATQNYVKSSGKSKPLATKLDVASLITALVVGLLPLALIPPHLYWALIAVAFVWVWFSLILNRRIGGYTGDCLGAMQQLTEIAFYLGVLACISI